MTGWWPGADVDVFLECDDCWSGRRLLMQMMVISCKSDDIRVVFSWELISNPLNGCLFIPCHPALELLKPWDVLAWSAQHLARPWQNNALSVRPPRQSAMPWRVNSSTPWMARNNRLPLHSLGHWVGVWRSFGFVVSDSVSDSFRVG